MLSGWSCTTDQSSFCCWHWCCCSWPWWVWDPASGASANTRQTSSGIQKNEKTRKKVGKKRNDPFHFDGMLRELCLCPKVWSTSTWVFTSLRLVQTRHGLVLGPSFYIFLITMIYIAIHYHVSHNLSPCITILRHALHANAMDHEFHEFHALIYHISYCFGWHGQADQVGTYM